MTEPVDTAHTLPFAGHYNASPKYEPYPTLPSLAHRETLPWGSFTASRPIIHIRSYRIFISGTIHAVLDGHGATVPAKPEDRAALIATLFEQHGPAFTRFLDGMFLIVLINDATQELFICNNRYQATRLYYHHNNGRLFFAHSLCALLALLPERPAFDPRSIPSFLATGFSHTEHTQLTGIRRLLPTCYIHAARQTITVKDLWQGEFSFARRPFDDLERHLDRYEETFRASIDGFLAEARPQHLGCLLSGGHDTSFVFIQAAKLVKRPIHTFTASFENFGFDESPKAEHLTRLFGGIHHRIPISDRELDLLPSMIALTEEPAPGGAFPIFACAHHAHRLVDTILTGDAGDTLWGEYYPVAEWHRLLCRLPFTLRAGILALNKAALSVIDWERLWESEHVFSLFAARDMYAQFFSRLCTYRHYNNGFLADLLDPHAFPDLAPHTCGITIPFTRESFDDALIEAKMLYGLYQYMLPPTQKAFEGLGTRCFPPYLNKGVIDFINQLPHDWLNGGTRFRKLTNDAHKRRFLKHALLRYLPSRYVYSVQQSLDVPFHSFLTQRPVLLALLQKRLKRRGFFNERTIDRLFDEFPRQKVKPYELCELKHHGYRLFCLLSLELWLMQFVDRAEVPVPQSPLEAYLGRDA